MLASIAECEQFCSLPAAKLQNLFEITSDWGVKSAKGRDTTVVATLAPYLHEFDEKNVVSYIDVCY